MTEQYAELLKDICERFTLVGHSRTHRRWFRWMSEFAGAGNKKSKVAVVMEAFKGKLDHNGAHLMDSPYLGFYVLMPAKIDDWPDHLRVIGETEFIWRQIIAQIEHQQTEADSCNPLLQHLKLSGIIYEQLEMYYDDGWTGWVIQIPITYQPNTTYNPELWQ